MNSRSISKRAAMLAVAALCLVFGGAPAMADERCGADTIGLDSASWPFLEAALQQAAAARAEHGEAPCAPPALVGKLRLEAAEHAAEAVATVSRRTNPCDARLSESRCGRNEMVERVVPQNDAMPPEAQATVLTMDEATGPPSRLARRPVKKTGIAGRSG